MRSVMGWHGDNLSYDVYRLSFRYSNFSLFEDPLITLTWRRAYQGRLPYEWKHYGVMGKRQMGNDSRLTYRCTHVLGYVLDVSVVRHYFFYCFFNCLWP